MCWRAYKFGRIGSCIIVIITNTPPACFASKIVTNLEMFLLLKLIKLCRRVNKNILCCIGQLCTNFPVCKKYLKTKCFRNITTYILVYFPVYNRTIISYIYFYSIVQFTSNIWWRWDSNPQPRWLVLLVPNINR